MSEDAGAGEGSGLGVGTLDRPPGPDDRVVLAGMVWTLYDDLDALSALRFVLFVPEGDNPASAELAEFLDRWGPAWGQIAATRDAVVDQILAADLEQLRSAGLAGAQLAMKMAGWRYGRARMLAAFDDSDDASDVALPLELGQGSPPAGVVAESTTVGSRRPGRLRQACRWIADSLGFGDTLLGTLAGLVSLSEPLKEGKEFVERVAGTMGEG